MEQYLYYTTYLLTALTPICAIAMLIGVPVAIWKYIFS